MGRSRSSSASFWLARSVVEPGGRGAVDRPRHRIGQEQPVFAYRMIARDTVEEKIDEELAEAAVPRQGPGSQEADVGRAL
jgi:hypothetical protein